MAKQPSHLLFVALFAVLFLVVFNYTITLMAGVYIVGDLGGSNFITTYTVAFYSVGNALGVPLAKAFSGRFGQVRLLILCLILFTIVSWICAQAPTFPFFVVARFFQGLVSGPFYLLVNRLLAKWTPEEKKDRFTALTLTIFIITPALGASWGGWIAYDFHWSWIFHINNPIILGVAWIIARYGEEDPPQEKQVHFDWVGYIFYFIGVLGIVSALTIGQEIDWFRSTLFTLLLVGGMICFGFFILWDIDHPYPVLKLSLLKNFVFSFSLFYLAGLFSAYFGMVILLALWLKLYVEYTPDWIGVLLGTMAVSGFFPAFLVNKRLRINDCRIPLGLAALLLAISCFHTMFFNVEINFGRIAFSRLLAGFGLAFFLPPIFRLCFRTFPEKETANVVIIFQFVRAISSGLGAALYTVLWQRRLVFYHDRLGGDLTPFSEQTQAYFAKAKEIHLSPDQAKSQLDLLLNKQATALALDDCFFFMGWLLIILLFFILATCFTKRQNFYPESLHKKPLNLSTPYPKN